MAEEKSNKIEKAAKVTAEGAKKVGKTIVSNPTTTLYVVGGIAAIYVGYKLVSYINNMFTGDGGVENNIPFSFQVNRNLLSITDEQANNYASQLLEAFNHKQFQPFGIPSTAATDEDKIEEIIDQINAEDFKLIYIKFGQKDYSHIAGGSPSANWIGGQTSEKHDLIWWLKEEISSFWDRTLYNKIKTLVESAGAVF